jgi:hypothetical protein
MSTERRLHEFVPMESLAHTQAALTPHPFPAGTMGDGPGVARLVIRWLYEVAERPA